MKTIELTQGTPEWHAHRLTHCNALAIREHGRKTSQTHKYNVNWHDFLSYNPKTGVLVWKVKRPGPTTAAGRQVGSITYNGLYRSFVYKHRRYLTHRVIWQMVYGNITDDMCIDHIDGNGLNNRIENLRLVTRTGNQRNRRVNKNHPTGVMGVTRHANGRGYCIWCANKYIGYSENIEEAISMRREAEGKNGYHENSGRQLLEKRVLHNLAQGTKEWLEHRRRYYNASEAPIMMAASRHKTREQFLCEKKTGATEELSHWQKTLFERGHKEEAVIRNAIEKETGYEFFPAVYSVEVEGLKLSASLDGIAFDGECILECKLWNKSLSEQIKCGELEPHYYWQLEQQLLVSGAKKAILAAGNEQGQFEYMEYRPVYGRQGQLIQGWQQFEKDLNLYEASRLQVRLPAKAIEPLPVLQLQAKGQMLASNLDSVKAQLQAVLDNLPQRLESDDDFAASEAYIKFSKEAEKKLAEAKERLIDGMPDIAHTFQTVDSLSGRLRDNRLYYEKAVKTEKENRKLALIDKAVMKIINPDGNDILSPNQTQEAVIRADLAAAIRGLKTLSGIQNAIDKVTLQWLAKPASAPPQDNQQDNKPFIALDDINRAIAPLCLFSDEIAGLNEAAQANDWQAIKTALIAHIEHAIQSA